MIITSTMTPQNHTNRKWFIVNKPKNDTYKMFTSEYFFLWQYNCTIKDNVVDIQSKKKKPTTPDGLIVVELLALSMEFLELPKHQLNIPAGEWSREMRYTVAGIFNLTLNQIEPCQWWKAAETVLFGKPP